MFATSLAGYKVSQCSKQCSSIISSPELVVVHFNHATQGLHGKHGVGVPEPECRSRSPGVKFMENTESKIWKTRSLI